MAGRIPGKNQERRKKGRGLRTGPEGGSNAGGAGTEGSEERRWAAISEEPALGPGRTSTTDIGV